jgi:hypothetical protein
MRFLVENVIEEMLIEEMLIEEMWLKAYDESVKRKMILRVYRHW